MSGAGPTSLLTQTYPQDPNGYHLHGNSLIVAGEFDPAAEAYRKALLLDADYSLSRANLALALIGLNRFDEAQGVIQQGLERLQAQVAARTKVSADEERTAGRGGVSKNH